MIEIRPNNQLHDELLIFEPKFDLLDFKSFQILLKSTLLVRHGQTSLNERKVLQGSTNSILSQKGIEEIEIQKETLLRSPITIEMIFSSSMARAIQTAEILSNKDKQIIVVPNMHEYNYGEWEGMNISDIISDKNREEWTRKRLSLEEIFGPKNGESFIHFLTRINNALKEILISISTIKKDSKSLVVCHAEVLRAIRFLSLLSKEKGVASPHNIRILEENFSFDKNGNFLKVPHGIIELKNNSFVSYFPN